MLPRRSSLLNNIVKYIMRLKLLYILLVIFVGLVLLFIYNYYNMSTSKPIQAIQAIAVFNDTIKGTVKFTEVNDLKKIKIELNLSGLKPNSFHGFHVHEAGDLTDKCTSMCAQTCNDLSVVVSAYDHHHTAKER